MEEVGVEAQVGDFAFASECLFETSGERHHEVNLAFHVKLSSHDVVSRERGISFHWIDIALLANVDFRPASARAWLLSGGREGSCWATEIVNKV